MFEAGLEYVWRLAGLAGPRAETKGRLPRDAARSRLPHNHLSPDKTGIELLYLLRQGGCDWACWGLTLGGETPVATWEGAT